MAKNVDQQCIEKILDYRARLVERLPKINDLNDGEYEDNDTACYAVMCVCQMYELCKLIRKEEIRSKLLYIYSPDVSDLRNIFSHNYAALSWRVAMKICDNLLDRITVSLLHDCLSMCSANGLSYALKAETLTESDL